MTAVTAATASGGRRFDPRRLEQVFECCFAAQYRTQLRGGAPEPLYQPASGRGGMHGLWYREDYFASALHEAAHWCIAGEARRKRVDFGYWYAPDGRSPQQQRAFESVEYQPQALEWYFAKACAYRFRLSVDNLGGLKGVMPDNSAFRRRVLAQATRWQQQGLPARAQRFYRCLCREFSVVSAVETLDFSEEQLL